MSTDETFESPQSPWPARLEELAAAVRDAAREQARSVSNAFDTPRPLSMGVGDFTYSLDAATESACDAWLAREAARGPLSLFTEDRGWRHAGPGPGAAHVELADFDHGGPRIVIDPVDGTRNLMADLRSAWTVIACAGPGSGQPRLCEVEHGLLSELPDSRAARYRVLSATGGRGASYQECSFEGPPAADRRALLADSEDRVDHGYFSFFRYTPALRPLIGLLEADFFERLAREEGADTRHCFDDQYISNGGQLALLALGTYRFVADLRAHLAPRISEACTTSKPYDCAGAILVAREAGCVLTDPAGATLDFPLDGSTPVSFVGYANEKSARRMLPQLNASLEALG